MSDHRMSSHSPQGGSRTPQYSNTPSYRAGDSSPPSRRSHNESTYRAPPSPGAYSGTGALTPADHDDVNIEGDDERYPRSPVYHSPVASPQARSSTPPVAVPTKRARRVIFSDDEDGDEPPEEAAAPPPKKKRFKPTTSSSSSSKQKKRRERERESSEDDLVDNVWPSDADIDVDVEIEAAISSAGDGESDYENSDRGRGKKGGKKATPAKAGKAKQTTTKKPSKAEPKKGLTARGSVKSLLDTPDTQPTSSASTPASTSTSTKENAVKRKLPTIKKNKSGTGPESQPRPSPLSKPTDHLGAINRKVVADREIAKDLDLRDPNALKSLMQAMPRARGREKDERQQENNRNRAEYQKKMVQDYKPTFDLQAQRERIQAFEARLLKVQSDIALPNVLGAKMRQVYNAKERERERSAAGLEEEEEGEVPE